MCVTHQTYTSHLAIYDTVPTKIEPFTSDDFLPSGESQHPDQVEAGRATSRSQRQHVACALPVCPWWPRLPSRVELHPAGTREVVQGEIGGHTFDPIN